MSRSRLAAALLVALVPGVDASAAAVSCARMVGDASAWLDAHPQASGTSPQTVAAQLQHQPTRKSLADAKSMSRERVEQLLRVARAQQQTGDMKSCQTTLGDVERMLKP